VNRTIPNFAVRFVAIVARMRYVLTSLLLVASSANASNWVEVAKLESDGGVLLVDDAHIIEVKGFRSAWFKSIYTTDRSIPKEYQAVAFKAQSYRWVESMSYFNCSERTSAAAEFRWYNAEDKGIGNLHLNLLTFRKVAPGAVDEQVLEAICKAKTAEPPIPIEEQARITRVMNPDAYYPSGSSRRGEHGSPVVQVCVGPSGKLLREPVVEESSGFPDLDHAAIKFAKDTRYAAGKKNGTALPESCVKFKVKFDLKKH
jgi:TonB family protein